MDNSNNNNDQKKSTTELNAETRRIPKSQIEELIRKDKQTQSTNPFNLSEDQDKQKKDSNQTIIIHKEDLNIHKEKHDGKTIENNPIDKTQTHSPAIIK